MPTPSPEEQIQFLTNIQRLLSEGLFTATYKFALLAALADLSVEAGDDSGDSLVLTTFVISEKFVEYYWRHATPYVAANTAAILRQNTDRTVKILTVVSTARKMYGDSLASLQRDRKAWERTVRAFLPTLIENPLPRLQKLGSQTLDFLYASCNRHAIELRPGVAYCFRQFHPLIQDVVRAAWLRSVRSMNGELLGETTDLREFLFGAERGALAAAKPVLMDLQDGRCFYCAKPIRSDSSEVDHFIPWAKYPADLAHNLVLADRTCNNNKRDRMAHEDHLAAWAERNQTHGVEIASRLSGQITCDLASANRVAFWAYAQTESAGGLTWMRGDELAALMPSWRTHLRL